MEGAQEVNKGECAHLPCMSCHDPLLSRKQRPSNSTSSSQAIHFARSFTWLGSPVMAGGPGAAHRPHDLGCWPAACCCLLACLACQPQAVPTCWSAAQIHDLCLPSDLTQVLVDVGVRKNHTQGAVTLVLRFAQFFTAFRKEVLTSGNLILDKDKPGSSHHNHSQAMPNPDMGPTHQLGTLWAFS